MDRKRLLLAAAVATMTAAGAIPDARADRLGANYRGPGDAYRLRQDPPPPSRSAVDRDPLLHSLGLGRPFLSGVEAGRREAAFRGRPLLVFLVLRDCGTCGEVARAAFGDPAVLELAGRTVPVVADAEREESFGVSHAVKTVPTILLLDAEGREAGRAEGAVDAARLTAVLRDGLKRAGAPRPTPAARALETIADHLSRARRAKEWRSILDHAALVERIGHDGPERDEAREARAEAVREAASRLDAARGLLANGERVAARRTLARIARDFAGIDEAAEAADLLRELDGSGAMDRGHGRLWRAMGGLDPGTMEVREIPQEGLNREPVQDGPILRDAPEPAPKGIDPPVEDP